MKAKIKVKNKYTYPIYTVVQGKEVINSFYCKKQAVTFRNTLNEK